jgi:hypothetical protein
MRGMFQGLGFWRFFRNFAKKPPDLQVKPIESLGSKRAEPANTDDERLSHHRNIHHNYC